MLQSLGVGTAQAILLACGGAPKRPVGPIALDPELTTWLRDAVSTLRGAGFASAHVLAVSRRRTTGAIDVLGAGVARSRADGVVLTVRDKAGALREQVTNDLSRAGVAAAVRELTGSSRVKSASVDFGPTPRPPTVPSPDPLEITDGAVLERVDALASRDPHLSSRVVYASALLDIDDAHVWSVAPGRMLEQRLVRVRRSVSRVAWHGSRPVVSEASRAWTGGIDAQDLTDEEIVAARENVLVLMTPRAFDEAERNFVLGPSVTASVIDAVVRAMLTRDAQRIAEVGAGFATGAALGTQVLSVIDDPTVSDAYGSYVFDDRGERGTPATLIDHGTIAGRIEHERRPGHVGLGETLPSHVRVLPGNAERDAMLDEGVLLEEPTDTLVDPASGRLVIQIARAREWQAGRRTGRIFADIEIVGDTRTLLGSLGDASKQTRAIGIRDELDGQPRWHSVDAPWLRGRGVVRQRRRPT